MAGYGYGYGNRGGIAGLMAAAQERRAQERAIGRYLAHLRPMQGHDRRRESPQHRHSPHGHHSSTNHASHWVEKSMIAGYDPVKRLEKGGLSESVKVARHRPTGTVRVLKRVNSRARPREELEVLKRIPKHCHLNYMVEYALISRTEVQLVLEYCNLGDLAQLLKSHINKGQTLPEGFVWEVLEDVGKGLAFLHSGIKDPTRESHSQKDWDTICHLDIKPANIFIKSGDRPGDRPLIVLGDFGCAITRIDVEARRESSIAHRYGTRNWFPPHSISDEVGQRNLAYGWHTDIWQLGAVAASLCQLRPRPNQHNLFIGHLSPVGPRYGRALDQVVSSCVRYDRTRRPRAADLVRTVVRRRR